MIIGQLTVRLYVTGEIFTGYVTVAAFFFDSEGGVQGVGLFEIGFGEVGFFEVGGYDGFGFIWV